MARITEEPKLQGYLPGQEPVKNDRVHKAALRYHKLMLERKAAGDEEHDAHTTLLKTMQEEGLESYEYSTLSVFIDETQKCKVKIEKKAVEEKPEPKAKKAKKPKEESAKEESA